ncbi:IS66 family insertion sequence element accessory protein TnpB [Paenibacillus polymyxa]|uniref:IS66 family insertion sequence element accessory protein TnpB n=1 Tax=Paenibacillus polymyxa TaxID=1406 RepID=UPI0017831F0B|nr:hypothetical protein DI243_13825 [Paenibacillus polymyxa]
MLTLSNSHRVYLAAGTTDLRKSIDGLAALVQEGFVSIPSLQACSCSAKREMQQAKFSFGI